MKKIVLSKENMLEVQELLDSIINGEASFAESDFFYPIHPHMGEWLGKENRIASRVGNHWMFTHYQETGIRHHSDKPGNETLLRLNCHALSCDILHAGDILHFIDNKTVVIERDYLMANAKGKFLKISLVRKLEELTKKEVMDAAYLEIDMRARLEEDFHWMAEQEEKEYQKEIEKEEFCFNILDQDEFWEIQEFNSIGEPDPENLLPAF